MHHHPARAGNLGGLRRRHAAGGVVAIGQHDHHLLGGVAVVEQLDAEADGIAQRRAGAGHAGHHVRDQRSHQRVVQREGGERVRGVAEDDQADAVAGAVGDEIPYYLAHGVHAGVQRAGGVAEVAGIHRLGKVQRHQQVAHGLLLI
ncbi:hypothetical protein D3C81_1368980 [compost metagenome]